MTARKQPLRAPVQPRILRNLSTPESREWWCRAEEIAAQADSWPDSRRAGINVEPERKVKR